MINRTKKFTCMVMLIITYFSLKAQHKDAIEKVTVYTTAQNTNLRLTRGGTLIFKDFKLSNENESCVFIDPQKKFKLY